jgi:hypothetical protein
VASNEEDKEESGGGTNVAGIVAGVVVGVVVIAAALGGGFLFMRRKRNKEIEEEHRRNAAVNAFIGKAPGSSGGSITDARLDPVMAHRRMSDGSIADNQDYSRKILRVRHPTHSFLIVNFLLTRTRSPMHDRPRQSDDDKRTRPVFSLLTSAASSAFWGGGGGWGDGYSTSLCRTLGGGSVKARERNLPGGRLLISFVCSGWARACRGTWGIGNPLCEAGVLRGHPSVVLCYTF